MTVPFLPIYDPRLVVRDLLGSLQIVLTRVLKVGPPSLLDETAAAVLAGMELEEVCRNPSEVSWLARRTQQFSDAVTSGVASELM